MKARKGFIFSMDAILAVVLLVLFLVAFSFFSSSAIENPYTLLMMQKQANDVLLILDKNEELGTMDTELMETSLNSTLTSSLSWNMQMEYYNHSGGLMHLGNFTFGQDYTDADQIVLVERLFVVFDENQTYGNAKSVKYYGVARLRLWAE